MRLTRVAQHALHHLENTCRAHPQTASCGASLETMIARAWSSKTDELTVDEATARAAVVHISVSGNVVAALPLETPRG